MTLVSANKLKKRGFFWDMFTDTLIVKETGQQICEIKEHYGLSIIEYNLESIDIGFANSVRHAIRQKQLLGNSIFGSVIAGQR